MVRDVRGQGALVDSLYLKSVSRKPTPQERAVAEKLVGSPARCEGAEDLLWTAADGADRPVGVLAATIADDALHVVTLAIARAHRCRGVGRALLERAIGHGRWAFFPAVTVTAGVEASFYRRFGFVALRSDRLSPDLAAFLRAERDADGPGVERIAMAKVL